MGPAPRRLPLVAPLDDDAIARGLERLRREGWVDGDPPTLTDAGVRYRVSVEDATDRAEACVLEGVLTDAERDELFGILRPMAATICAGGGYPADPNDRSLPGVDD